ncbi:MAG TPA: Fe(2+)-trafficking protein [Tepidisphaeraceae bacterium]|nr:Fe(2+)-trafficking protein [Tepidisphaeraceae bacterium]
MSDNTATTDRIDRFKFMADADPTNEMAHLSLGKAYVDAGRFADALEPLRKAVELKKDFSKAYHLLGQAQLKVGNQGEAVATLTQGVKIADERGDILPRNDMVDLLKSVGAAVPEIKQSAGPAVAVGEGQVMCRRCGKAGPKLDKPPFRNEMGQKIFAQTCVPCWREAIGLGTKVINELRLELADPRAQKVWDQNVREFLNLE